MTRDILVVGAAATSSRVDRIVVTSVDHGGEDASWSQPTNVPHFAAEYRIEHHSRDVTEAVCKLWTILRPTGFIDTYNPGFFGGLMTSLWSAGMLTDRRIQLISTQDIGIFAAHVLLNPEEWNGKALSLAGDALPLPELQETFKRTVGMDKPKTYDVLAYPVLWTVKDASAGFKWFKDVGYKADIDGLRELEPGL